MIQQDGEIWAPPYNREEITEQYLSQNMQGDRERILDYHRFVFEDDDLSTTREELLCSKKDLWKGSKIALAHNVGTTGNIEYRCIGRRTGQQIIFDPNGNIVTTPENKGTYDYIVPRPTNYSRLKNHNYYDVNPWIRYGNSAKDTTTEQQRRDSLRESKTGQIGNTLWGAR